MPDIDFQKIVLNLIPKKEDEPVVFYASQYETARPFIADLMWGESEFAPGDSCWAEIDIRKVDDNLVVITDDVTIDNNEVSVVLPVQALTCVGDNFGQVKIYADVDNLVAALNFILRVQPDPLAGGVTSETAIDNLTTQIDDIISGEGYVKDTDLDVLQSDWDEADPTSPAYIKNKPSGGTQEQADWTEEDTTAPSYIRNKPDLSIYAESSDLATVATSGSYNDLLDKPTIPVAQIQSDYAQTNSGAVDYIKNKPALPFEDKGQYLIETTPAIKRAIEFTTLIGGTCGVNQLVDTGDTSVNTISGHKYLTRINGVESIIAGGSAVSINDSSEDNVIDLTAMFGTTIADYAYTLESGTAGAGITWLKNNGFFTADYYPYNAGALLSVKTSKKITTGKNLFALNKSPYMSAQNMGVTVNSETESALSITSSNVAYACRQLFYKFPAGTYTISLGETTKTGTETPVISIYDYPNGILIVNSLSANNSVVFTLSVETVLDIRLFATGNTAEINTVTFNNVQIEFSNQATAYEAYTAHEYTLDDIDLRGILKLDGNNNLYYDGDTYSSSGEVVRRFEYRAYASGDESLPDTITDGTYTVTKLVTPTTETADPFTNPMIVDGDGTEQFVDGRTVEMPVGHDTFYIPMN